MSEYSRRTGPAPGYYDTGRKDSKGRPIYQKIPERSAAGSGGPPPGSQTPMDDHEVIDLDPEDFEVEYEEGPVPPPEAPPEPPDPDDPDFSDELSLGVEIRGVLDEHERVRRIDEKDDVFEVTFRSGDQLVVNPNPDEGEDDEVELVHYTEDEEGEPVEETVVIKRKDLGEALTTIADADGDHDEGGGSMLPLMAAKGLFMSNRRRRRRRRGRKRQGNQRAPKQQGLAAYWVQNFFDMAFPGREH